MRSSQTTPPLTVFSLKTTKWGNTRPKFYTRQMDVGSKGLKYRLPGKAQEVLLFPTVMMPHALNGCRQRQFSTTGTCWIRGALLWWSRRKQGTCSLSSPRSYCFMYCPFLYLTNVRSVLTVLQYSASFMASAVFT